MLVTLHHSLQLVLSKANRIGDTKYHIWCSPTKSVGWILDDLWWNNHTFKPHGNPLQFKCWTSLIQEPHRPWACHPSVCGGHGCNRPGCLGVAHDHPTCAGKDWSPCPAIFWNHARHLVPNTNLHCCNTCHLPSVYSSKFWSSMTIFHHKLMTRGGRVLGQ